METRAVKRSHKLFREIVELPPLGNFKEEVKQIFQVFLCFHSYLLWQRSRQDDLFDLACWWVISVASLLPEHSFTLINTGLV